MSGAGIVATKDVRLIHCGLQLLVARGALGSAGETVLEVPSPATTKQTTDSGHGAGGGAGDGGEGQGQEQLGCAAAAVSPAGDLIAVCDDRKQVCVFRVSDLRDQYQIIIHTSSFVLELFLKHHCKNMFVFSVRTSLRLRMIMMKDIDEWYCPL